MKIFVLYVFIYNLNRKEKLKYFGFYRDLKSETRRDEYPMENGECMSQRRFHETYPGPRAVTWFVAGR